MVSVLSKKDVSGFPAKIINNGLAFLELSQQKNGSFISLSSADPDKMSGAIEFHTLFSSALILSCLNNLPNSHLQQQIKKNIATFLLSQKNADWSFNYWQKNTPEAKKLPYPDDLDDTFCALSSLMQHDSSLITAEVMAGVVKVLTTTEVETGGPYQTWIVDENAAKVWKDVDLAVNANVAFFLSLHDIYLPQLETFFDLHIKNEQLFSPYYDSLYPIVYFLARSYQGKFRAELREIVKKRSLADRSTRHDNVLTTALLISTLVRMDEPPENIKPLVEKLYAQIAEKGWQAHPFYIGVNPKRDKTFYAGSAALTAACSIEACTLYKSATEKKSQSQKRVHQKKEISKKQTSSLHEKIINRADQRIQQLQPELKEKMTDCLAEVIAADTHHQITLLPQLFCQCLKSSDSIISDELLIKMGLANLYGWLAYTVADDFLDDEGNPTELSAALVGHREMTSIFARLLPETAFGEVFSEVMDRIDCANQWELTHCRVNSKKGILHFDKKTLPDFANLQRLADRSFGHALTPIAIAFALGMKKDDLQLHSLRQFFIHFLIARQLDDDAHDWQKDLEKGHLTSVNTLILKRIRLPARMKLTLHLHKLQHIFWNDVIDDVHKLVHEHVRRAEASLVNCTFITQPALLLHLLAKHRNSVDKAIQEREKTLSFLEFYQV
jgi:hypothetical protein